MNAMVFSIVQKNNLTQFVKLSFCNIFVYKTLLTPKFICTTFFKVKIQVNLEIRRPFITN